jgi:hypothetical protein
MPAAAAIDWASWDALMRSKPDTASLEGAELVAAMRQFHRRYERTISNLRRQAIGFGGLAPVPVNGSVKQGMKQGFYRVPLREGGFGYLQRGLDDCLQAGVASLLQISPIKAPDVKLFELLATMKPDEVGEVVVERLSAWQCKAGVQITIDTEPPWDEERWVGVVVGEDLGHCLLMNGATPVFDCGIGLPGWSGPEILSDPGLIDYGITIEVRPTSVDARPMKFRPR